MAPRGTSSANPGSLDGYVGVLRPADEQLNLALAGLPALVEGWNARPSAFGGRVDAAKVAAVDAAVNELSYLDEWVGKVAVAFRDVDRFCPSSGCGPVLSAGDLHITASAGPPSLAIAVSSGRFSGLLTVIRDGRDGETRVVRLNVDTLPEGMSQLEWQLVAEAYGVTAEAGPLHTVVHGWSASTGNATSAGGATADLYDTEGVEGATVLVVDWAAGEGTDAGLGTISDFNGAEARAQDTGDAIAPLFTAIASSNPDAEVAVTAHSLGNHVAARALTRMTDPSCRFGVDLVALQPAIPADAPTDDPENYGALASPRVRTLTVSINNGDNALFWYEARPGAPEALGDEASHGDGLTALLERREAMNLDTTVVDHDNAAGGGHLGLNPDADDQGLVRSLGQEQVDRVATGHPSPQTGVREWLYRTDPGNADELMQDPDARAYFDERQAAGRLPTAAGLARAVA